MPDQPEPTEEQLEERLRKLLGEAESADGDELDAIELKLKSLEDKLEASSSQRKERDGFFDAEFEDRLDKLHARADASKNIREGVKSEQHRRSTLESATARGLGNGLSIAYTIIGLPLVGVGIGWAADRWLHTTNGKGIGMLIGAAVGMAMAFVMTKKNDIK